MNLWFHIHRRGGPRFRIFVPELVVWSGFYLLLLLPLEYLVARAIFSPRRWRRLRVLSKARDLLESARGLEVEVDDGETDFLLAFRK